MMLTPEHFQQFSALSGDDHPIHSDDDYARRCGMPGAVAHGLHLLATGATGATSLSDHIHDSTLAMLGTNARFLRPAVSGDVLHREVEVVAIEPKGAERGVLRLRLRIHNQRGELLLEGEHQLLLRRRSAAANSDASTPASEAAVQTSAADGIAVIRFNNPPMNTLAHTLRSGVLGELQRAIADATVKAIVLIGGGRAFCSGAEIREFNTPKAAISPNSRELIAAARARLASRPDTEHEQGIVRLIVSAALGAYLLPDGLAVFGWRALDFHYLVFTSYFVFSTVLLAWILMSSTISHLRRCLAVAADCATTAIAMWYYGPQALAMILVFVWVTLANGFRYGPTDRKSTRLNSSHT